MKTEEIKGWKRQAIIIGHIVAILWFWFVTITSFNDFKVITPLSPFFGIIFALVFTFNSYRIIKQNSNKRFYYYNLTIVILASIVIFVTYRYIKLFEFENASIATILEMLSIIPTILSKKILNISEQPESNIHRHSLEKIKTEEIKGWKRQAIIIGHIVAILWFWFVTITSFNDFKVITLLSPFFGIIFALVFTFNSYRIIKQNSNKRFYYYNLTIVILASIVIFVTYRYIKLFEFENASIATILEMLSIIPSIINIITIKKYGEYPAIEIREKEQIKEEKYTEKEEAVLKDVSLEIQYGQKENRQNEFKKPIEIIKQNIIDIKTAFGYKGAAIIYKLKIENNTSDPISDIKVYPYVPDVFMLRDKEKSIALIEPKSSQTVTFEIRPTGECGDCNVSGRVNYYDMASRKRQDIELEQKSLSIVCPMLHGKEISEAEWHDTVSNLVKTEESTREIDMPAESLFTMVSRIIKDMHMHMQKPEVTKNHKLFNGVARFYGEGVKGLKYAAQVEVVGGAKKSKLILKVWAEKEDALTGFYHGMLDEIEKRVNVKEYIDDSIVQYNVHIGDKIGTLVKDSVVQRSTIGASARKCPNCGREVEANEKFCLECGAKL